MTHVHGIKITIPKDLDAGVSVERNGKVWEMTPRAALEGRYDPLVCKIWYKTMGFGGKYDLDDTIQSSRLFISQNIGKYDQAKGTPATYIENLIGYALHRMRRHVGTVTEVSNTRDEQRVSVFSVSGHTRVAADINENDPAGWLEGFRDRRDPSTEYDTKEMIAELRKSFSLMTPNEQYVLSRRWETIVDYERHQGDADTLLEVGHDLGLCRERARQIQHAAIAKMREFALPWASDETKRLELRGEGPGRVEHAALAYNKTSCGSRAFPGYVATYCVVHREVYSTKQVCETYRLSYEVTKKILKLLCGRGLTYESKSGPKSARYYLGTDIAKYTRDLAEHGWSHEEDEYLRTEWRRKKVGKCTQDRTQP